MLETCVAEQDQVHDAVRTSLILFTNNQASELWPVIDISNLVSLYIFLTDAEVVKPVLNNEEKTRTWVYVRNEENK